MAIRPLTQTQRRYLLAIGQKGYLIRGQDGWTSTRTVRILSERGLVQLDPYLRPGARWEASLTLKGSSALADLLREERS